MAPAESLERVLVTAAGSGPAVAVIKALRKAGRRVVAIDMNERSAGLLLADVGLRVPPASGTGFVDAILSACQDHQIQMVIPILDIENLALADSVDRFSEAGVHLAMNSRSCLEKSHDKQQAARVCQTAGIRQPRRFERPEDAPPECFPLIGKPSRGVGARGIVRLESPDDLGHRNSERIEPMVWQQFIAGREYSVDTFGAADSDWFVAVPRVRHLVRNGQMVQGWTDRNSSIQRLSRDVVAAFGADDVCCIQWMEAENGEIYFIEINPRYGTGVSLSIEAGVDFPLLQWLARTNPGAIQGAMLEFEDRLEMIRYWQEAWRRGSSHDSA